MFDNGREIEEIICNQLRYFWKNAYLCSVKMPCKKARWLMVRCQ